MRLSESQRGWLLVAWVALFGMLYAGMVVRTKAPRLVALMTPFSARPTP